MRRLVALICLLAGLGLGGALAQTPPLQFDETPSAPLNASLSAAFPGYDISVHSRDSDTWCDNCLTTVHAQHSASCGGPPATHDNKSYASAAFVCAGHIMTAIHSGGGYALVAITPTYILDVSSGSATVQFDVSTQKQSGRDWIDFWVTPFADSTALPFDIGEADLQGTPRNGIHVNMFNNRGEVSVIKDFVETVLNPSSGPAITDDIAPGTNQAAVRQTFKLTITPGHLKFERLQSSTAAPLTFFDSSTPAVNLGKSTVLFAQHSYNPEKDNACAEYVATGFPCGPTWHWDNFLLSPAAPFTVIKSDKRAIISNSNTGGTLTFAQKAPSNAFLHFSAICTIYLDDGPGLVPQHFLGHPEHVSSYLVPIAQGKQSVNVTFGADGWYTPGFGCHIKDVSIWSMSGAGPLPTPTRTPQPTLTPTRTPTPAATSSLPTPTATFVPVPTATQPPVSPTPFPTATPQPAPVCNQSYYRNLVDTVGAMIHCP